MSLIFGFFGIFVLGPLLCIPLVRIVVTHARKRPRGLRAAVMCLVLSFGFPVVFFLVLTGSIKSIDGIKTIGPRVTGEYLRCDVRDPAVARATLVLKNDRADPLFLTKNMVALSFNGMYGVNEANKFHGPVVIQTEIAGSSSGAAPVYILASGERMRLDLESRDVPAIARVRGLTLPICTAQLTLDEMIGGVYPGKMNLDTSGTVDSPEPK